MALTVPGIYGTLAASRAVGAFPFNGRPFETFAQALAQAIVSWGVGQQANLGLTGVAVGVSGAGAINPLASKLIVPPTSPVVLAALVGAGFNGPLASSLATTVAQGLATAFTSQGQYIGSVAGVGVGVDVSKVTTANSGTLQSLLMANFLGLLGTGPLVTPLATGLANGITSLLLLGTGTGTVTGVATVPPAPASTPTFSTVV